MKKINIRTAVVTGGLSGIGKKIVESLIKDGFKLFVLDKKFQAVSVKGASDYIQMDLASPSSIREVGYKIGQKVKKIDVLVNCAGIYPSIHWDEYDFETWQNCLNVNVTGPYLLIKELLPLMAKCKKGYIINITSGAVYLGSRDPGYSASKGALAGLTKSLAKNFADHNILVNAIAPGPIDTPMSRKGMRQGDISEYIKNIPLHRFGEAGEVANIVSFLVSGKADYMNGSTIHINGGLFLN